MKKIIFISLFFVSMMIFFSNFSKRLPIVAIANYGSLKDINISIDGIKSELEKNGFIENKNIKIEIADVAFDHSLIPQIVTKLKNQKPKVMVVISTPIAQFAKGQIKNIPLVFDAITDPIAEGILQSEFEPNENITGSSDRQNLDILLAFSKEIFPNAKTIGMFNLTSDVNDAFLIEMMKKSAKKFGLSIMCVPIDHVRDIPIRMQKFKGKVDFIYVGASGLHTAMPTISMEAIKMNIPVLDSEDQSVKNGLALASFGVNYETVGRNAGKLISKILKTSEKNNFNEWRDLPKPIFPKAEDHKCFVNEKLAKKFGIKIPKNVTIIKEVRK